MTKQEKRKPGNEATKQARTHVGAVIAEMHKRGMKVAGRYFQCVCVCVCVCHT